MHAGCLLAGQPQARRFPPPPLRASRAASPSCVEQHRLGCSASPVLAAQALSSMLSLTVPSLAADATAGLNARDPAVFEACLQAAHEASTRLMQGLASASAVGRGCAWLMRAITQHACVPFTWPSALHHSLPGPAAIAREPGPQALVAHVAAERRALASDLEAGPLADAASRAAGLEGRLEEAEAALEAARRERDDDAIAFDDALRRCR
jgi:hypothetical protein